MIIDDVNLEENIFGPNIGELKGKSARSKPKPIKYGVVEIKNELIKKHKDLKHFMYIMFVDYIPIITVIDRNLGY